MKATSNANRLWEIYRLPFVIALFSAIGLIAALTGDGWLDLLSWLTLAVPPAVVIWAVRR